MNVTSGGFEGALLGINGVFYGTRGYRGFTYGNGVGTILAQGAICFATRAIGCVSRLAIIRVSATLPDGLFGIGTWTITLLGVIVGRYNGGIVYNACNIGIAYGI